MINDQNQPLTPLDTLEALLRAIADPKSFSDRLQKLKDQRDNTVAEYVKLIDGVKKFEADRKDANAKLDVREKAVAKREEAAAKLEDRQDAIEKREAKVIADRRAVDELSATHALREADLKARADKLDKSETAHRNNVAALDARADKLAKAEDDYKKRIASLRALAG